MRWRDYCALNHPIPGPFSHAVRPKCIHSAVQSLGRNRSVGQAPGIQTFPYKWRTKPAVLMGEYLQDPCALIGPRVKSPVLRAGYCRPMAHFRPVSQFGSDSKLSTQAARKICVFFFGLRSPVLCRELLACRPRRRPPAHVLLTVARPSSWSAIVFPSCLPVRTGAPRPW